MEAPAIDRREEVAPPLAPARAVYSEPVALIAMLAGLVALAAWLSFGDTWERVSERIGLGSRRITSIAVLPFENLTGSAQQDYFVDGMTEVLTTDLAQFKALQVASRTSAMQYKRRDKPLAQIANELKVDAVVGGAIMRSENRVRVTVQLIEAATDRHLWAKAYEREVRDVLTLQIDLPEAIAAAIHVQVRPDERQRLARSQTASPEAYDEYPQRAVLLEQS